LAWEPILLITKKLFEIMDEFMAVVKLFAGNFAPQGWMFCHGQTLSINSNTALFSLIGTTYGGNGQTTFCLPDLRSRVAVGFGQGAGLSNVALGQVGGTELVTLTQNQMPVHNHVVTVRINAGSDAGITDNANNTVFVHETRSGGDAPTNYTTDPIVTQLKPEATTVTVANAGGSQPHENRQPYLGLNYIICVHGIYPSRS
jgi:microcystin-dependent protein